MSCANLTPPVLVWVAGESTIPPAWMEGQKVESPVFGSGRGSGSMIPASVSDVPDGGPRAQVGGVDGEMAADRG